MMEKIFLIVFVVLASCTSAPFEFKQGKPDSKIAFVISRKSNDSIWVLRKKPLYLKYNKNIVYSSFQYFENRQYLELFGAYKIYDRDEKKLQYAEFRLKNTDKYEYNLVLNKNNSISREEFNRILTQNKLPIKPKIFLDTLYIDDLKSLRKNSPQLFRILESKKDTIAIYYTEEGRREIFKKKRFGIDW